MFSRSLQQKQSPCFVTKKLISDSLPFRCSAHARRSLCASDDCYGNIEFIEYLFRQFTSSTKLFSRRLSFSVIAILRAQKDYWTSISSLSYAASVKMLIMTLQPDLIQAVFDRQILVMHITIYSLISVLVAKLCNMICSNGFKKSF